MSEDLKQTETTQEPETKPEVSTSQEDTPSLSTFEQEQYEKGWRPKEVWVAEGGNPDEWRSAREFKDRGELYQSLHDIKRQLKQKDQALTALQRHHQMVFEKAHKQAVSDLKKERREAMRADDVDRLEQVEQEIEERTAEFERQKQEMVQAAQTQNAVQGGQVHPDFQVWVEKNKWYNTDDELREFADTIGLLHAQKNPGISPAQVLDHVEKRVRKQFAEKFGGGRRAAPNPTATPSKGTKGSSQSSTSNDEIESLGGNVEIMNTLIRNGTLTKEKYIEDLKKVQKR